MPDTPTGAHLPATWPIARLVAVLRGHLPDLVQQEDIARLGVFGSYVRNEQTPTSDLDVLVDSATVPTTA